MKLHTSLTTAVAVLALASQAGASSSSSRHDWHLGQWSPGIHNVENAIYYEWCGHHYTYCGDGNWAWKVSDCESGHRTDAVNGEHEGLFQMGSGERRRFGHGPGPWVQARSARKYYLISGTSPWDASRSCWG